MGKIKEPGKVKLIVGMLSNDTVLLEKVKPILTNNFGEIDFVSQIISFDYTDYYEKEMGKNIKRQFLSFVDLISPEKLAEIKVKTNEIEEQFADESGNRKLNLDPGYINLAKLVLASTKDFAHRIYLGKGIFTEITLMYRNKTFVPVEWTYPDYKTPEYIDIFKKIRDKYVCESK